MPLSVYLLMLSTIFGCLGLATAEQVVKSNPQGSFAMGYTSGYINGGDYDVVVREGNDDIKREVLIASEQYHVRDSVNMVYNTNTMVFSNWDGWFKLGNLVYTDEPGVLYFMRSDGRCDKKFYAKQLGEIRAIDRDNFDESFCHALKAKVDDKMKHFLEVPFKYMLPEADLELKQSKGFPGGEYYTDKVYGDVNVGQHTVILPPGDSDKEREIAITAPGVKDTVTMEVNSHTQIYGKWDGSFYIGDKVYTNEPRVLYVDDDKGGCVKKVFKDYDSTISVAFTKMLKADECFSIKTEVYNNMEKLIADPKLLAAEKKPKSPPKTLPPITVTSTVVFPKQDQNSPSSTIAGAAQSTHTITVAPSNTGYQANMGASTISQDNVQGRVDTNVQLNPASQQPMYSSGSGTTYRSRMSSVKSDYSSVKTTSAPKLPNYPQQPMYSSGSGITSNVHMSSVSSDHPAYPSVTATSVTQIPNSPQQNPQPTNQLQAIVLNQGQSARITSEGVTLMQPNSAVSNQQLYLSTKGGIQMASSPSSSPQEISFTPQSGNSGTVTLQSTGQTSTPPVDQSSNLNINSQNLKIQPDGSFLVDGGSMILQGLEPNTQLVTPDGNVIRVSRSVNQGYQQQESAQSYQTVTLASQGNSPPVVTLMGNSQTPTGNVQTLLTVPPNQVASSIEHTTMVNVPGKVNTNFVVKSEQQQPSPKIYLLQSSSNGNSAPSTNSPLLLKLVQPASPPPTVLTFKTQSTTQNIQNQNQNLIRVQNQPNLMLTTTSQANTISLNRDKPVLLSLQNPVPGSQATSKVNLRLGSSGGSILINSQEGQTQVGASIQSSNTQKQNHVAGANENSQFNLMRDLKLDSPVNNLILNIAKNTIFNKRK